ncbi:MAG: serine hydrolase [Phycisphaerae bacterium]|nr:serine hydrolase [Phycisphaerae bacterium]
MLNLRHIRTVWAGLMGFALATSAVIAEGPKLPKKLRENIDQRIAAKSAPAFVVGLVGPDGVTWLCRGTYSFDDSTKVTPKTVFEIGSITKAFTGILLADSARRGTVKLDDPIDKFLPESVAAPNFDGRQITLLDLAQHRSGLPRLPTNFDMTADPRNPYAHYSVDRLYEFLNGYKLTRSPGANYEYSNLGAGLLGHILGLANKKAYEDLVEERICRPLGMIDTVFTLTDDQRKRLAPGHDGPARTSNWDSFEAMSAAGALLSTGADMITFVEANLGFRESKLAATLADSIEPRADTQTPNVRIGLGWHISNDKGTEIIWHNGGTGGYRAFCGFAPSKKLGVVVLTNSSESADDIGFHLLEKKYRLKRPEKTASVSEEVLNRYVGYYELAPGMIIQITLSGGTLYAQLTGQDAAPVYPRSETEFAYRIVQARLTFQRNDDGTIESVTLHQNGRNMPAKRLPDDYQPPAPRQSIELPVEVLKRYEGRYQLTPGMIFDVKLEGKQLTVMLTGQPRFPLFAASETEFFLKVVDAQITFNVDESDRATSLTLHQSGMDQIATRITE